jgi:hypothetical protein
MLLPPLALLGVLIAAPPQPAPAVYRPGFDSIRTEDLRSWLEFLAAPELEGRESGTRGYDVAARYVASELARSGVAPGAGGSYFQTLALVRRERDFEAARLTISGGDGQDEAIPLKGQIDVSSRTPWRSLSWDDPWVFAGRGRGAAEDESDDLHGLDLAGRVVLIAPADLRASRPYQSAWLRGARRIAVVSDERVKAARPQGVELPEHHPGLAPPVAGDAEEPEVVYLTRAVADRILARHGTSLERLTSGGARPASFSLDSIRVRLELPLRETRRPTANVVGYLEGSDPVLREEAVVIGAHLDHVGVHDGKIHPGADDDASGSSAVLGVARALAMNGSRPRRSVLLLFFAAEEKGLFGSSFFVSRPAFDAGKIVLQIQLDMVGRDEERKDADPKKAELAADNADTLHVVGSKRSSLELDPWVHSVNDLVGLRLEYDEERVYNRSDQYHFAERGIPVVFFFSGFHADYHQPGDTPDKINYQKLTAVTRLAFALVYEVADREGRLKRNRL